MYTRAEFTDDCMDIFKRTEGNLQDIPGVCETLLFEEPLIGFADASDRIFSSFGRDDVIGPCFLTPGQWLPGAGTVVSFFLPFSETVRVSNRSDRTEPSIGWRYARVEGQEFIGSFMRNIKKLLEEKGIAACIPAQEERFVLEMEPVSTPAGPDYNVQCSWSERHAAYACGLGTFGLSKCFISEKGTAGRIASIIVSEKWEPTGRGYTRIDEYCVKCGACIRNCPMQAISAEYGKNHMLCNARIEETREIYAPRYGCGKCQVGVPCEARAPGLRNKQTLIKTDERSAQQLKRTGE